MSMDPYEIKVYDTRPNGHHSLSVLERLGVGDIERLRAFYKFEVLFTHGYERAQAGQLWWGLAGFELKAGPAVLQPQVWGQDGVMLTGEGHDIWLILSWPDASELHPDFDPRYAETGEIGRTAGRGSVGWGFGQESHIGPEGGPFMVWATSDPKDWAPEIRRMGSDAVGRLGWWDEHIVPNPIFQVMRKGGDLPVPIPEGTKYLANVDKTGRITDHISFRPGMPSLGDAGLVLMEDGKVTHWIAWEPRAV